MAATRLLVTGSEGYIGSVLVPLLLGNGYDMIGIDSYFFPLNGDRLSTTPYRRVQKDIRDLKLEDFAGVEHLVHLAALSNDPLGEINPKLTEEINHHATLRLARLAKAAGVRRSVFASSCSVYGSQEGLLDETAPVQPLSAYARSKAAAEAELLNLASETFSPIVLRNATVYGPSPNMRSDLVLNNLISLAHLTGLVKLMSDGRAWRPMVHVIDVASAILLCLKRPIEALHAQIFNIGFNDQNYQIRKLASEIHRVFPDFRISITDWNHDKRSYRVDFSKAKKYLDLVPKKTVGDGIKEVIRLFKTRRVSYEQLFGEDYVRLERLQSLLSQRLLDEKLRWVQK